MVCQAPVIFDMAPAPVPAPTRDRRGVLVSYPLAITGGGEHSAAMSTASRSGPPGVVTIYTKHTTAPAVWSSTASSWW